MTKNKQTRYGRRDRQAWLFFSYVCVCVIAITTTASSITSGTYVILLVLSIHVLSIHAVCTYVLCMRGVLVLCRNASTGPPLVGLPWPIFQNYKAPLLASHYGASMAAGTGPSKVLCIMLIGPTERRKIKGLLRIREGRKREGREKGKVKGRKEIEGQESEKGKGDGKWDGRGGKGREGKGGGKGGKGRERQKRGRGGEERGREGR